ncbi:hypothetical protein Y1Q_0021766 [Alligator mississippiensis]|uniref:Uncharacterized protein n=1 Tax=Alligator mississippiensis TaxID=8496 RepID=A0A151PBD6_ALLMI|nr:hypothetical protein Y1Q_0021766 [Alligator mississippiensis]
MNTVCPQRLGGHGKFLQVVAVMSVTGSMVMEKNAGIEAHCHNKAGRKVMGIHFQNLFRTYLQNFLMWSMDEQKTS